MSGLRHRVVPHPLYLCRELIRSSVRFDSQQKALIAASAAREKHAEGLVIMDVRELSGVTDFFVIATADSRPQLKAMRDAIEDALLQCGQRLEHVEGFPQAPRAHGARGQRRVARETAAYNDGLAWVLLDCGSVVVHLFDPPAREFYQLEHLWGDAPRIPL